MLPTIELDGKALSTYSKVACRHPSPPASPCPFNTRPLSQPAPEPASEFPLFTETPLDHEWYPDIVDNIISFASLSSLRAFRQASRYYEKHVTPMMYKHCLVEASPAPECTSASAIPEVGLHATGVTPSSTSAKELLPIPLTGSSLPLLAHLDTLDIVGPHIPRTLSEYLSARATPLKTVRLLPNGAGRIATQFPAADKLVLVGNYEFRSRIRPKGLRKVVHNNPSLADLKLNSFHCEYEGAVPHIVLNFSAWADKKRKRDEEQPEPTATVTATPTRAPRRAHNLAMVILLLLAASGTFGVTRRITIVGLDGIKLGWLGLAASGDKEDVEGTAAAFHSYVAGDDDESIANVRDLLLGSGAAALLAASVEYLSLDEYAASMTPDELALETVM